MPTTELRFEVHSEGVDLLGEALGLCLARVEGLSAAYLPEGLLEGAAESLVRAANQANPQAPPFSILVTLAGHDISDPTCLRLSPAEAIRYRQGNRLAVVQGRHPDLASFVQAFREELAADYPSEPHPATTLEALAASCIELVLERAGMTSTRATLAETKAAAAEQLVCCMRLLRDTYELLNSGTRTWNTYWFRHIAHGLDYAVEALRDLSRDDPSANLRAVLLAVIPAALALPSSPAGLRARDMVDALSTWWGDGESIRHSAQLLRNHPDNPHLGQAHPIEKLAWEEAGKVFATDGYDNPLLVFQATDPDGAERVQAYRLLTSNQFVSPSGSLRGKALEVTLADGSPLTPSANIGAPILIPFRANPLMVRGISYYQSHKLRISVPVAALDESHAIDALSIACSLGAVSWETLTVVGLVDDGVRGQQVVVEGRLIRKASLKDSTRRVTLRATAPGSSALGIAIGSGSPLNVTLLPAKSPAVVVMPVTRNRLGTPKYFGADALGRDGEGVEFGEEPTQFLFVLAPEGDMVEFAHRPLPPWRDGISSYAGVVSPRDLDVLLIGDRVIECHGYESDDDFQSPIIAAASQSQVSSQVRPESLRTLRADFETLVSELATTGDLSAGLVHCVLTEDEPAGPLQTELYPEFALRMSEELRSRWSAITAFTVPSAIRDSEAWLEFSRAFQDLGVADSLIESGTREGAEWPSRTSWRHLWDDQRPALEAYLESYAALVRQAQELGDPSAVFWASYPFSISVWKTTPYAECTAVLLSPLHPIRLAWLASVESAVWESQDAHALMGLVEGWNLPLLGANHASGSQLMAIPMDHGAGQVFLGWSMLVDASPTVPKPIATPRRMAGRPSPGASASGLNGAAVAEALATFRRINPHVTTLTLDLAAQAPTTRLREIDLAVLDAAASWGSNGGASRATAGVLAGGVRILDSLNRAGDPPANEVSRVLAEDRSIPLTWSRYEFRPARPIPCNLRLLQDSAINLAISDVGGAHTHNTGVLTSRPLRRFDAAVEPNSSDTYPGVRNDGGWAPWARALEAVESAYPESAKVMRAHVHPGLLATKNADWTVSGEALVHPGALSRMLGESSRGAQMLWEWRPPVLSASNGADHIERRPYISVVRVPRSFREQVASLLKSAGIPDPDVEVTRVLQTLGARGIGLSSLIAIGGTHAQGALGFYLALRLMESARAEDGEVLVLPIDACDSFLRALAGDGSVDSSLQRADLLMIRLADDEVVLAPIEIKFYLSAPWDHPGGVIQEATTQVASTISLLNGIRDRQHQGRDHAQGGERSLWHMALATLVETGLKLRRNRSGDAATLAKRLRNVADGTSAVRVGYPLVTFFGAASSSRPGNEFAVDRAQRLTVGKASITVGLLRASAPAAFDHLAPQGQLAREWAGLVEWSLGTPSPTIDEPELQVPSEPEPEPAGHEVEVEAGPAGPEQGSAVGTTEAEPVDRLEPEPESGPTRQTPALEPVELENEQEEPEIWGSGVRFSLGSRTDSIGVALAEFWPGNTALTQLNVGVVGDLGTGKTQILKTLVHELRRTARETQENPVSILILDYKSDFRDSSFLESVGGVVYPPRHIPLNVFALEGHTPYERAGAFIDVLAKIYGGIGPVQKQRLSQAIRQCYEDSIAEPTMGQVYEAYREATGDAPDSVSSILEMFVMYEVFSEKKDELKSFKELMADRVVVIGLSELGVQKDAKNAIVALFLNFYFEYMLKSTKWPFVGSFPQLRRLNSYLLIDEASNIMKYGFPVLEEILIQGREFGVGVILSAQYLSQFRAAGYSYAEPLRTWLIHRVPQLTVTELRQLGLVQANDQLVARVQTQEQHECYYRSLDVDGSFITETPFYRLRS
jgi:hypothetical protein